MLSLSTRNCKGWALLAPPLWRVLGKGDVETVAPSLPRGGTHCTSPSVYSPLILIGLLLVSCTGTQDEPALTTTPAAYRYADLIGTQHTHIERML